MKLKHYIIFLSVLAGAVLTDLLTKIFLYGVDSTFLPYIIGFRDAPLNYGAAWNFLSGHSWVFCVLAVLFVSGVVVFDVFFKYKKPVVYSVGIGFLLAGTLGNLIDRIFIGGVRDFLFFEFAPSFPTFNFADTCLTIGCILLAVFMLFLYKPDEKKKAVAGTPKGTEEVKAEKTKSGGSDGEV